eukprot:341058-Amphidinium_carterae.1
MEEDPRERVTTLGAEIRSLKAQLKAEGLKASDINKHEKVVALVAELAELKKALPEGDSLTDQAFFAQQQKEREVREEQRKKQMEEQRLKNTPSNPSVLPVRKQQKELKQVDGCNWGNSSLGTK